MKRNGATKTWQSVLLLVQASLIAILYFLVMTNLHKNDIDTYSLATSIQHLAHSVSPYTTLRTSSKWITLKDYSTSRRLSSDDHAMLKHFLLDYIEFHKSNRYNGTRRLVFTPGGTGIGDRFLCMLTAYWVAVLSRRVFLVRWEEPFPLQDFMTSATDELKIFYNHRSDAPKYIKHSENDMVPDAAYLHNDKASLDRYEDVFLSKTQTVFLSTNKYPHYFPETFMKNRLPEFMFGINVPMVVSNYNFKRAVLHHFFRLSDEIAEDFERVSVKLGLRKKELLPPTTFLISNRTFSRRTRLPYIAVHARIGKGVLEGQSRFTGISQNMKVAAECLASRAIRVSGMCGTPALPIFLATDTTEFREQFADVVKQMSKGSIKVVNGDWGVAHSTRLHARRPKNGTLVESSEDRRKMWGTYMDLAMLGHGEHIIGLYSSFTRLALSIGNAESLTELRNEICLNANMWST